MLKIISKNSFASEGRTANYIIIILRSSDHSLKLNGAKSENEIGEVILSEFELTNTLDIFVVIRVQISTEAISEKRYTSKIKYAPNTLLAKGIWEYFRKKKLIFYLHN